MILGFKARFREPILKGTKIHTIREDSKNRWKAGNKIHFATGVRTSNYKQFKEGKCFSIQKIEIQYPDKHRLMPLVIIDGFCLPHDEVEELAIKDGFKNIAEFKQWFNKDFTGKLIHWTDYQY